MEDAQPKGIDDGDTWGLVTLAERMGLEDSDWLMRLHTGSRRPETMDFDFADALLCAMGKYDLWYTELRDIYYGTTLLETCETEGCKRKVTSKTDDKAGGLCDVCLNPYRSWAKRAA